MLENPQITIEKIRKNLKLYIQDNNICSLVIGVSGGIDSALCCALAKPVCKELNISLIGVSLPCDSNKQDEKDRAGAIITSFCSHQHSLCYPIDKIYEHTFDFILGFEDKDSDSKDVKIRKGNIKARLRMMYLYDVAQKNKGMVLSTDNYTEYMLGFWTLHGDVGDFGMIQELWKTEVYQIANEILMYELEMDGEIEALNKCIQAVPTDGLGITNSDLDQLCAESYDEVDSILMDDTEVYHPIILRRRHTWYKRNNPYNIKRDDII